jgi:hypothetical protein
VVGGNRLVASLSYLTLKEAYTDTGACRESVIASADSSDPTCFDEWSRSLPQTKVPRKLLAIVAQSTAAAAAFDETESIP